MKVLVTGAAGFLGRHVIAAFSQQGRAVGAVVRKPVPEAPPSNVEWVPLGELAEVRDWSAQIRGVDAVVHLAGQTAVGSNAGEDVLGWYRRANVQTTSAIAQAAAAAGVRRFVFISTIKVNGEATTGRPFTARGDPAPQDAYGTSKYEAELALREIEARTGMEVCIIRPPLVYGPDAKGNFKALLSMVAKGVPLPLASVRNRRSLVGLDNLCDLIACCVEHPAAGGGTFLVSDGEDLSTPELIRRLARVMGRRARLIPVPVSVLRAGGALLGRGDMVSRLVDSLEIDIRYTCETLDWKPPVSMDEGLRRAAHA